MSTTTAADLDLMPSLDNLLQCESDGAEEVHGEGEEAAAIVRVRCPGCGYLDSAFFGPLCVQMLRECIAEGFSDPCLKCPTLIDEQHFVIVAI